MRILTNKQADEIISMLDAYSKGEKVNALNFIINQLRLKPLTYRFKIWWSVWCSIQTCRILYFWESKFVRLWCTHKSERTYWDHENKKGQFICNKCWKKRDDDNVKLKDVDGLFSIGSDGIYEE